ncbi:hypothetical protein [Allokutzneria sp. NRRL B-24872]|uniref:hypothetical protein n=1 Tax=Allokutzneria sp. NRRL B-24872 TaxID=1137961 RepID=UPI000A3CE347|nr:hypothetical protein [Allokutzneria sp. NRRL B-24872]
MYDDFLPYELYETDPAEVVEQVSKYGVALLVEQVNGDERKRLFREARNLTHAHGDRVVLRRENTGAEGASLKWAFDQPWMHTVAEAFFGAEPFVFNPEITLITAEPGNPNPVPQVEDGPGLTFLLYVTGVDADNGVMRAILGSHSVGKRLPSAEPTDRLAKLTGEMGTVVVIDNDVTLRNAIVRKHPRITAAARCYKG